MEKNVLDAAATELEALIKSQEPEKQEASIADELVKSAAMDEGDEGKEEEEDEEEDEGAMKKSLTPVSDELRKSLAESDEYQQAYDVSDVIGVLGDAMVKGFTGMDSAVRGTRSQIARLEKQLGLVMRGLAVVLKQQEERTPVRRPMTGQFGGMQKSQTTQAATHNGTLPFTVKQLERAADVLAEKRQLAPGSLAVIDSRGIEHFYKSLGADKQKLFADTIEAEHIAA